MSLKPQIGQFILFIGFVVLIIFIITDQAQTPNYLYFCSGTTLLFLGIYLMWLGRAPAQPSNRFSLLHKIKEKRDKKRMP